VVRRGLRAVEASGTHPQPRGSLSQFPLPWSCNGGCLVLGMGQVIGLHSGTCLSISWSPW
jgi:hypothetical protein